MSDYALAQVVVLPSFEPEYILSIEARKDRYLLLYNTGQQSIHQVLSAKKGEKVVVHSRQIEISKELAITLAHLWNTAIQQVRYPTPEMSMRTDGVKFIFMTFQAGIGERSGETWSPVAGSRMSLLTGIVTDLKQLVLTPQDQELLQQQLLRHANLLNKQLQVP